MAPGRQFNTEQVSHVRLHKACNPAIGRGGWHLSRVAFNAAAWCPDDAGSFLPRSFRLCVSVLADCAERPPSGPNSCALTQGHFSYIILVVLLRVRPEKHLYSSYDAGSVQPYFRRFRVQPQQSQFWIVFAAFIPGRYEWIPKPVNCASVVIASNSAVHSREQVMTLRSEGRYGSVILR